MKHFAELLLVIGWLAGVALAEGFWLTAAAVVVPIYAWYLVVMKAMTLLGWIPATC